MILPQEQNDPAARQLLRERERRIAKASLWMTPVLLVLGWLLAGRYWNSLLFLQSPNEFPGLLHSRIGLLGGIAAASIPCVWFASTRFSKLDKQPAAGIILTTIVVAILLVGSVVLNHPKARFTLEEAVKARAPQLDFVRNIVFKQQQLRAAADQLPANQTRVALIGSSQINLGIDSESLKTQSGAEQVISVCMPGMVPIQYLALRDRLLDQKPTHVVCWLSEFDFFRETTLPTVRLRWCSAPPNVRQIAATLDAEQKLRNRSELADLFFASRVSIWQQRSLLQMALFRFCWPWDAQQQDIDEDEAAIGGTLVGKDQGIDNIRRNIQRTPMVDSNFAAFELFASGFPTANTRLIVIEGESHPDAMKVYAPEFRSETRKRLTELAAANSAVEYITAQQRPTFTESDWRDAVHLNAQGRQKLTRFVSQLIKTQ